MSLLSNVFCPQAWRGPMCTSESRAPIKSTWCLSLEEQESGYDRFTPNCTQIYSVPRLTSLECDLWALNSKGQLFSLTKQGSRRGTQTSQLPAQAVTCDRTGHIRLCAPADLRRDKQPLLGITSEWNWLSSSVPKH